MYRGSITVLRLALCAAASVLPVSCKAPGSAASSVVASGATPSRISLKEGNAPGRKIGRLGAGGGTRIVVDLSKPRAAGDGATACWFGFPPGTALGRAVCDADPRLGSEYTAQAVDLTCSADPAHGVLRAARPLSLKDCQTWSVYVYDFEPALSVQIGD